MEERGFTADEVVASAVRASGHALTPYQKAFLADDATFRAVLKARQTGFSRLFALEALANAIANRRFSIFVSLNREEAAEKILYARDLYDGLPDAMRPRLVCAGSREMRFQGGGRLLSFPCHAPRGRAGASVYLDEMAFYPHSQRVYEGAIPVITHGGRITAASTPNGDRGAFYRLVGDPVLREEFSQHCVPWWRAPWLCTNVEAATADPDDDTDRRVCLYGTNVLRRLRATLDREAFQQEYELRFVDTNNAYIGWREIEANACDLELATTWAALAAMPGPLYAGIDVGRVNHATEIVVLREKGAGFAVCCLKGMVQAPFQVQEDAIMGCLAIPTVTRACIDSTGIGRELSERISALCRGRAMAVNFTAQIKEVMSRLLLKSFEQGTLAIPRDRSLMDQLHSVRRTVTDAGRSVFTAPTEGSHHADKYWALALALHAASTRPATMRVTTLR